MTPSNWRVANDAEPCILTIFRLLVQFRRQARVHPAVPMKPTVRDTQKP